jgi:hypothetical protein
VLKGRARQLERDSEIQRVEGLGVSPWAPEPKDRWVRIEITEIGGRTFQRARPAGA